MFHHNKIIPFEFAVWCIAFGVAAAVCCSGCSIHRADQTVSNTAVSDRKHQMTKTKFIQAVRSAGLSRYEDKISHLCLNSIAIICEAADESELRIGESKLGGLPDLPPGVDWPECKGEPLSFIAQFRMSDVTEYDTDRLLPSTGMTYFFYDADQGAWGYDPADAGRWKVIYYGGELSRLQRKPAPAVLLEQARFRACRVIFSREDSFPSWESYDVQNLGMSKKEMSAYQSILAPIDEYREEHPTHRILGQADIIQNDMQLECQLVTHGLYCGDESGYQDSRAAVLAAGATGWQLLLQIDTEDEIGMMWGDAGRLYFWIQRDALKKRDFDQVWVILQCY